MSDRDHDGQPTWIDANRPEHLSRIGAWVRRHKEAQHLTWMDIQRMADRDGLKTVSTTFSRLAAMRIRRDGNEKPREDVSDVLLWWLNARVFHRRQSEMAAFLETGLWPEENPTARAVADGLVHTYLSIRHAKLRETVLAAAEHAREIDRQLRQMGTPPAQPARSPEARENAREARQERERRLNDTRRTARDKARGEPEQPAEEHDEDEPGAAGASR